MLVHNITTQSSFRVLFSPQGVCVNFCTLREPSNCLHMKARPSISKSFTCALSWFFEKTCFLDLFWNEETSLLEFYSVDEIHRTKRIEWVIRVHKAEKLYKFLAKTIMNWRLWSHNAKTENFKRSGTSSNSAKIDYKMKAFQDANRTKWKLLIRTLMLSRARTLCWRFLKLQKSKSFYPPQQSHLHKTPIALNLL